MAKEKKTVLAALNMALLGTIVAATKAKSFIYCTDADNAPFLTYKDGPLVEVDPTGVRNPEGKIATRATNAGIALVDSAATPGFGAAAAADVPAATNGAKPTYNIVTVELGDKPKRTRPEGIGQSKYPFDKLPAPTPEQANRKAWPSFFVPATDDVPEPWKSLSSTANGAQKRLFGTVKGDKEVTRAKRGNGRGAKALRDAAGNKITETVKVPDYEYSGEFTLFRRDDGAAWGFPGQKGVVIARTR